jgi:hypothetical protein
VPVTAVLFAAVPQTKAFSQDTKTSDVKIKDVYTIYSYTKAFPISDVSEFKLQKI